MNGAAGRFKNVDASGRRVRLAATGGVVLVSRGDAQGVTSGRCVLTLFPVITTNFHALAHLVEDVATREPERRVRRADLSSVSRGAQHPPHVFGMANQDPNRSLHAQQRRHHGLTSLAVSLSLRRRVSPRKYSRSGRFDWRTAKNAGHDREQVACPSPRAFPPCFRSSRNRRDNRPSVDHQPPVS